MAKKLKINEKGIAASSLAVAKAVHRIHFEDYGWQDFERLAFSYIYKQKNWDRIEWLGQTGSDGGRDIWGKIGNEYYCYQCANYRKLILKKVTDDIDKLFKEKFIPDYFIVICGGLVTSNQRDQIKAYATNKGIKETEVWSGVEFEEKLRNDTPDLIRRFVNGDAFPELPEKIIKPNTNLPDSNEVLSLVKKYRANKDMEKLQDLLLKIIDTPEFKDHYTEKLETLIFSDHYLIEYFASNFHEILIKFTNKYPAASIKRGEHIYHILTGLFADKSNQVYSEIRQYHKEEPKEFFLDEYWYFSSSEFKFTSKKDYHTQLPIISWLSSILGNFPSGLKEDVRYYLNQFVHRDSALYNNRIFSEKEIKLFLSTDNVFNSIQLFRILLVEVTFTNKRATTLIDRILLLYYSAWDFILLNTKQESTEVALDNDSYTINEYQLKYLFNGYLSLVILQEAAAVFHKPQTEENVSGRWVIKQLFSKVDSLIASQAVSEKSKEYYVTHLIEFYFKIPDYIGKKNMPAIKGIGDALLWQLKHSMSNSPFGKPAIFVSGFRKVCSNYEFYRNNNKGNIQRAKEFYNFLLPYTEELEWKICDI